MVKVRVPATSANLGVGYDCLGLALDDFATVTFEVIAEGLEIAGCEEAYCNEENLFYQAFVKGLQYMGESVSGIRITVDTDIPYARGLGSSATCIVAGLAGANALFHNRMNRYELFDLATQMEGHPDNIAPAIFGGVKRDLLFVTMIPDYEVSTKAAREVLPDTMRYRDAVYQMGRCAALAKAMEIGNAMIMRKACTDQMQEPYRKKLIMEYENVRSLCRETDMITMYISGSGSTMIALTQEEAAARVLVEKIKNQYPSWDARILRATYDGVQSEVC